LNNPVPRFFTPEPAIAKAAIINEPAKAFKDILKIHSYLFMSEHVMAKVIRDHVKIPRH
jgi:hypothetical protein